MQRSFAAVFFRVSWYTERIDHWNLGGKSPFGNSGDIRVRISKKLRSIRKSWKSQPINFLLRALKLNDSPLKTIQTSKLVEGRLDEVLQAVVLEQVSSNTKKHPKHSCSFCGFQPMRV